MTVLDGVQLKATDRVRSNFANAHLLHAHRFALEVHACETANQGEELGNFYDEIRAKTVATVISAAASLEAYVNEVPFDLEQNFPEQPTDLLRIAIDLQERRTLRERIDLLPQLKGNKSPSFGRSPAQDVGLLIVLRNSLVHYKPSWHDDRADHETLDRKLKSRFALSPFFPESEPLFPRACMSYGCAKWCVENVRDFIVDYATANEWVCGVKQMLPKLELPSN